MPIAEKTEERRISVTAAKKVLTIMMETGENPTIIIERLGLWLMPPEEVCEIVYFTVCDNPEIALKYVDGNTKVMNVLVGKAMAKVNGRATGEWIEECVVASLEYIYAPLFLKI